MIKAGDINKCIFSIKNKNCIFYFYDYFITLAEWREKQIKTILDE